MEDESIESDMLAVANFINWLLEGECLPANIEFLMDLALDENPNSLGGVIGSMSHFFF